MKFRRGSLSGGLVLLSIVIVLVLSLAQGVPAAKKKPILVGDISSYSGMATVLTFPYRKGVQMAVDEINSDGGVLGRPLEYIFRDDKMKPDEAVKAARELVYSKKVDFLSGALLSSVGLALSSWGKENNFLFFNTNASYTNRLTWDEGHPYVARTGQNVNQFIRSLAVEAATYPYKKWAVISLDYEYGHNMWEEFWSYLKELKPDVEAVQENWPKLGEGDYNAFITALLQSGAEAVVSGLWGGHEINFLKQAKPYGFFDKIHYFSQALGAPEQLIPLGKEVPLGAVALGFPWDDPAIMKKYPAMGEWAKRFREWSKGEEPRGMHAYGYEAVYIIAETIKRAGSIDHKKMVAVLDKGFEMEFPWGKTIMRGCDHQALKPQWVGVVRMNAQGTPVMMETKEMHGRELMRSCEEAMALRKAAQKK